MAERNVSGGKFGVELDIKEARQKYGEDLEGLCTIRRVTNYLAAAMLYLRDNFLLESPLKREHIKERLLGHWGTCPGINFVYSHCNYLTTKHNLNMFLVVGPGHGAPAVLANLYIEGSLRKFYPQFTDDYSGLKHLVKGFSWPGSFPSHVNAELPGTIHEGGELGYSLSHSYGAVMDNPDLIVACIVGDGEAETGPTASAWHCHKYLDPIESGAVLPVLHLNGFKISSSTIFGLMSDEELVYLFSGYGYNVRFVKQDRDVDADMCASMEWALKEIRNIQSRARSGKPIEKPYWPLIILQTLKGWTGVKELHGQKIEGSFRSHQLPLKDLSDKESFDKLEKWLTSYKVLELFDAKTGSIKPEVLVRAFIPPGNLKMGLNEHSMPKVKPLNLPEVNNFLDKGPAETNSIDEREKNKVSIMKATGKLLANVLELNPRNFRIFSPDELESNKLEDILEVTRRNNQWEQGGAGKGGKVIEMLSEHNIEGMMEGYSLTGRYGVFPSYESFLGIVTTMTIQYIKFQKISRQTRWREPVPSLTFIETSTLWRQEHNGFSHQDPIFLSALVNMKKDLVRIFLPPDANTFILTLNHCLESKGKVNVLVGTKNPFPQWLSLEEARSHALTGASVWKWASTDQGVDPHVVLVGCGNEVTTEVVQAANILKRDCPSLRVRVVNVSDLLILSKKGGHPHVLSNKAFDSLFAFDKPVIFNFHGYTSTIHHLIFDRPGKSRWHIHGYIEEGTTTTPFDMLAVNKVSRFHVAIRALKYGAIYDQRTQVDMSGLIARYRSSLKVHRDFIRQNGKDPENLNMI